MPAPRVLVVEDNVDLAFGLRINLEQDGYDVAVVHTAADAMAFTAMSPVSLIVLDVILPDHSGLDVLRSVRDQGLDLPIIILSARVDEIDRLTAFRLGADDYVTKPFSLPELLERIKVRLRTAGRGKPPGDIDVDTARRTVTCHGRPIHLTGKEFDLLWALFSADGAVLSKGQLLTQVWKYPADLDTRTVESHANVLRRKLAAAGLPHAIRTVHGKGLAWNPQALP